MMNPQSMVFTSENTVFNYVFFVADAISHRMSKSNKRQNGIAQLKNLFFQNNPYEYSAVSLHHNRDYGLNVL